jgi:hypothetical protein
MAKVFVSADLLAELVFGYTEHRVEIAAVELDESQQVFVFDIVGPGVPDADEVVAIVNVQQNRAGEKLHRMTFEARKPT